MPVDCNNKFSKNNQEKCHQRLVKIILKGQLIYDRYHLGYFHILLDFFVDKNTVKTKINISISF